VTTSTAIKAWTGRVRQRVWRLAASDREPIVLRHRRIYILPTRRGWALVATLTVMLVTSMNYTLSLGYALTFLAAGMVSATLLATFRNLAGMAAAPLAANEAFAGGNLAFTLTLASGARDRVGIVVAARQSTAIAVDLPPGANRPVTLSVPTTTRGALALGRVTVSTDFPLGIWRAWAYVHFPLSGTVYPAPEIAAPPLPAAGEGSAPRRSSEPADLELAGLRDYQPGDVQSRIAWKAIARGAGWYTKQFEGTAGGGTVRLDWAELPARMDVEAKLARLTAWVLAAERETRAFSLRIPGTNLAAERGAGHRRAALSALALFPRADHP
jgi:uncharacterized protein (DUF58 family)